MQLALLLLLAATSLQPRQQEPTQKSTVVRYEQRGSQAAPLVVKLDSAERAAESRQHEEERREAAQVERAISRYTLWLVIATAILGAITAGLWWATRRLVSGADATAERQLRAYVMIDNLEVIGSEPTSIAPRPYLLIVKNFGKTPAHDVDVRTVYDYGPPKQSDLEPLDLDSSPSSRTVIGPGGVLAIGCQPPPTPVAVLNAVQAGTTDLYVRGVIRYVDAFGQRRTTRFCHRRSRNRRVMEACAEGNDAD